MEKEDRGEKKERCDWSLVKMEKWLFLILLVMRNFGAASAASDNVQRRDEMEETIWKKEMVTDCLVEEEDKGKCEKLEKQRTGVECKKKSKAARRTPC